jgi:hypothetical protein
MPLLRSSSHPAAFPAVYTDTAAEYQAAANATAAHDASYMGRLKATGDDALDLINRMSTNKVVGLEPGQGAPTVLTTDRGRILDLIGVVNTGDHVLLVTSPGNQQAVIDWLDKYTILEDLTVEDITAKSTMIHLLGPGSESTLQAAASVALGTLRDFHTLSVQVGGHRVRIVRYPLGRLSGFLVITSPDTAAAVWDRLGNLGSVALGNEAYEALRVRYSVPRFGPEMGDDYNPLEAGLIGAIDFAKGCYIGQEVIARLDTYRKVQKHLASLLFSPDSAAAPGAALLHSDRPMGRVTSVARIPATVEDSRFIGGEIVGLGYVRTASAAVGTRLEVEAPAEGWAEVVELPMLFGPGQS